MSNVRKSTSMLLASAVLGSTLVGCGVTDFNQTTAPRLFNAPQVRQPISFRAQSDSAIKNRVLVGYNGTLNAQKIKQLEAKHNMKFVRAIEQINVAVFKTAGRTSMSSIKADKTFTFAGPDQSPRRIVAQQTNVRPGRVVRGNEDPMKKDQWSLDHVNAEKAWATTKGSGVVVAVVDTGVDLEHPDLKDNLVKGYNAEKPGELPQDGHYHGTHVAGIVAAVANNGQGVTGIAPEAKIMPVRTISRGGVAEVADGITWAADHGAKVINLSLGWDYPSSSVEETIKRAVKYAVDKNVVVCAALSNSSRYNPRSTPDNLSGKPGFEGVVGVGNIDKNDRRGGAPGEWKSVSSPGTRIMSTLPNNRYGNLTGTSMATPMVAGIAALMLSQNPGMKNSEVRDRLMATATDLGDDGFDKNFGAGKVNAAAVLAANGRLNAAFARRRFRIR